MCGNKPIMVKSMRTVSCLNALDKKMLGGSEMKKILIVIVTLLFGASLYGCTSSNQQPTVKEISSVEEVPLPIKMQIEEKIKPVAIREAIDKYYNALPDVNNRIDPKDVLAKIEQDPNSIFILDIRDLKGDRKKVPGAIHCWWYDVGKNIDRLPKDKQIIVHCWTGQAGMQVAVTLRLLGYDAWGMNGGWSNGWVKEGYKTEEYKETGDPFVWDDLNSSANAPVKKIPEQAQVKDIKKN